MSAHGDRRAFSTPPGSRGGSLRGGQDAFGDLRLRADSSSAHGGRANAEAAAAAANLEEGKETTGRSGSFSAKQHPQSAQNKSSADADGEDSDPNAWIVVRGKPRGNDNTVWHWPAHRGLRVYFQKWLGRDQPAEDLPTIESLLLSTVGAFAGILAITALNQLTFPRAGLQEAVPSFGASAVLVYGAFETPLAQPRNFVGGQILSAVIGCAFRNVFGPHMFWVSAPLAMSLSLLAMQVTRTTHPPGGATAFVAALLPDNTRGHSFIFVGGIAVGTFVMLLVALIVDNLHHTKRYPKLWFGSRWKSSWVP